MKPKGYEASIASVVVAWLQADGWDVYQEVEAHVGIADIVAVRTPVIAVVEAKTSLTLTVLAQAYRWRGVAHLTWAAVPAVSRTDDGRHFARTICRDHGLGLLTVHSGGHVEEIVPPALRRAIAPTLRNALRPEHKTHAVAGSNRGGHWTPFKQTVRDLRQAIAREPGRTLREVLAEVKHHYRTDSSARACIVSRIEQGVIEGIRLERDGKAWRLYPATPAAGSRA